MKPKKKLRNKLMKTNEEKKLKYKINSKIKKPKNKIKRKILKYMRTSLSKCTKMVKH